MLSNKNLLAAKFSTWYLWFLWIKEKKSYYVWCCKTGILLLRRYFLDIKSKQLSLRAPARAPSPAPAGARAPAHLASLTASRVYQQPTNYTYCNITQALNYQNPVNHSNQLTLRQQCTRNTWNISLFTSTLHMNKRGNTHRYVYRSKSQTI